MKWSNQQADALTAVAKWVRNPRAPQIFRLFGYAGTGKTTLARHIAEGITGNVVFAAFTGKASLVLKKKGCANASTIHSLIYKPKQDEDTGLVEFHLNPDSPIATATLVIIDEVSMVGEDLARDLLSYGVKVLVLGDPAQLPPVNGEGFFINAEPDILLTDIHRQAAENPIIRMSMDVREGRQLQPGRYGDSLIVRRNSVDQATMRSIVMEADQVLCGLNRTRQTYNERIRAIRGLAGRGQAWHPANGDRLVCLKNNHMKGLLNGGLWDVKSVGFIPSGKGGRFDLRVASVDEPQTAQIEVTVPNQFFVGTEKELDWRELREVDQFTFGYCLTVHKSQGSAWDNLVLFDESHVFKETAGNHLYTGITRAAERITVVV